jgi:hypothetical protein
VIEIKGAADLARLEQELAAAQRAYVGSGARGQIESGLIQLHRFVLANIEVDTARTKNSVSMQVVDLQGRLFSNVKYSPWVRDAGHSQQFFEYAKEQEGPAVLRRLGREFTLAVHREFS